MELENKKATIEAIIAQNRQNISAYGEYFGRMLFTVVATCPDLNWRKDVQADKNTLRKEVLAFALKAVNIRSINVIEKDLDGCPKIIINQEDNDPNLVFSVAEKPVFPEATRENVAECIERAKQKDNIPMFFSDRDLPKLLECIRVANQTALKFYEDLSRKAMDLSQTVRGIMQAGERMQADYLRQCGIGDDTETTIKIHAEISE